MDLSVTVHAGVTHIISTWIQRSCTCCIDRTEPTLIAGRIWPYWCSAGVRAVVAFLTHEWRTGLQQRGDVGTVRSMAVRAVFDCGLMCKQERAALLCMAGVACFINRILLQ